jgi:hypothetical protein
MNIAILIGISKYRTEAALPACAFDAENMRQLLAASGKYDDVALINDKTDASAVKDQLRSFFGKYQGTPDITEALVYFSGHGVFQNDALLCCSDFDAARPATTSLSNTEIDDLLRSVKPDVAVKVIDACQSGSPYIKDASAGFEKALGASKLNSFICMASSRQDQSSYASPTESAFTGKWIDAALGKGDGTVYYRDIQAALADAFVSDPDQTPYFVSQGTGLEVFAQVTEPLRNLKVRRAKSIAPAKAVDTIADLIEAEVKKRDRSFVALNTVVEAVEKGKEQLQAAAVQDALVARLYGKSSVVEGRLQDIPKRRAVAEFAFEQGWQKKYFVKVESETYRIRTPKDPMGLIGARGFLQKRDESDYVYETRTRPGHLETTEQLPFEVAKLSYTSQHPSLAAFDILIGVVHSLTDVMILSATVRLAQKGWSQRSPELSEVQWRYENFSWTDIVNDPSLLWTGSVNRGEGDIRAYLEALAPQQEAASAPATDEENGSA